MINRWISSLTASMLLSFANGCGETEKQESGAVDIEQREWIGDSSETDASENDEDKEVERVYNECFLAYVLKRPSSSQDRIVLKNLNTGATYSPENKYSHDWEPSHGLRFSELSFTGNGYDNQDLRGRPKPAISTYLDTDRLLPPLIFMVKHTYRPRNSSRGDRRIENDLFSFKGLYMTEDEIDEWNKPYSFERRAHDFDFIQPAASTEHGHIALIKDDDVYVIHNLEDGYPDKPLMHTPDIEAWPSWFPGGKKLLFSSKSYETDGNYQLFSVTLNKEEEELSAGGVMIKAFRSGTIEKITQTPGSEIEPIVSPNGRYVAYLSPVKKLDDFDVWTLNLQTGERDHITESSFSERDVAWMPDSKHLLFSVASYSNVIYRVSLADKSIEKLVEDEENTLRHPDIFCR